MLGIEENSDWSYGLHFTGFTHFEKSIIVMGTARFQQAV
jgi:hypothetical protein